MSAQNSDKVARSRKQVLVVSASLTAIVLVGWIMLNSLASYLSHQEREAALKEPTWKTLAPVTVPSDKWIRVNIPNHGKDLARVDVYNGCLHVRYPSWKDDLPSYPEACSDDFHPSKTTVRVSDKLDAGWIFVRVSRSVRKDNSVELIVRLREKPDTV